MPINLLDKAPRGLSGETVAVFLMDPGTTTGLGEFYFEMDSSRHTWEIVQEGVLRAWELGYGAGEDELDAAVRIAERFNGFTAEANMDGIALNRIFFVYEDFILVPGKQHSSVRSGISPARVTALVQGLLYKYDPIYMRQQPSEKSRVTNTQLREWDLWVRGSEHARDVMRHAVVWVRKALS